MKSLQKAVCAFSAFALGLASVAPFALSAGAIDAADTVTIPRSTVVQMFNAGGLSGQYLASDNTYQSFSWSLSSDNVKIVNDCVGVGNVGADSYAAWYFYKYTGWSPHVDSYGAQIQVPINLHFGNCSYISFNVYWGCVTGAYGANKQIGLSVGQQYNTLCVGQYSSDLVPVSARYTDNSVPAWSIATLLDGAPELGMMHVEIEQSNATDMYIGDLNVAWLNPTWRYNKIYFAITDIEINAGYTYIGRDQPPAYSSPVTTSPAVTGIQGNVSGTMVSGSDGWNVDYTLNVSVPDYRNDINPPLNSTQASVQTELAQNAENLHLDENALLSSAIEDIDLDCLTIPAFDPEEFEEAEPIFSFWNINLIAIMLSWVGIIAFVSYILFGKWV